MSRKMVVEIAIVALLAGVSSTTLAQDAEGPPPILFTNVDVFDGRGEKYSGK